MATRRSVLFSCFLASLFQVGCSDGSSSQRVSEHASPVINGWKAQHAGYPSIVALTTQWSKSAFCTGTLVAPDLVITAAHCVEGWDPDSILVAYGTDDPVHASDDKFRSVYAAEYHGDFNQDGCDEIVDLPVGEKCLITDSAVSNDVALVVLDEPIVGATCAPILTPDRYVAALGVGTTVRIAGYGENWVGSSSILYAGDLPVVRQTGFEMEIGLDVPGASNACFGDSGGPAYVVDEGQVKVTGVTSRSAFLPECGHGAIYSLPGSYEPWFKQMHANLACLRDTGAPCQVGIELPSLAQGCAVATMLPPAETRVLPDAGSSGGSGGTPGSGGNPAGGGFGGSGVTVPDPPKAPDVIEEPSCNISPDGPVPIFESIYGWVAGVLLTVFGLVWLFRSRRRETDE